MNRLLTQISTYWLVDTGTAHDDFYPKNHTGKS